MFEKILLFSKKYQIIPFLVTVVLLSNDKQCVVLTEPFTSLHQTTVLQIYYNKTAEFSFVGKVRDKCANLILCHGKGVVLPPVIMTVMLEKSSSIPSK